MWSGVVAVMLSATVEHKEELTARGGDGDGMDGTGTGRRWDGCGVAGDGHRYRKGLSRARGL